MNLYGHPWSINTRKILMTLAEKEAEARLVLVMIPHGEQKRPEHLRVHPFGKVPVLDDDGFVLYEVRAITTYLDMKLAGPRLIPEAPRERARMDQWISVADSYFVPSAHALIVERLFRRFLGGEPDAAAIASGRAGIEPALDAIDRALATQPFLAGQSFSLADIHWMPYLEYLTRTGEGEPIERRANLRRWWARCSERPSWRRVARSGPQPDDAGVRADDVAKLYR
jgi:glutathione S-transferase